MTPFAMPRVGILVAVTAIALTAVCVPVKPHDPFPVRMTATSTDGDGVVFARVVGDERTHRVEAVSDGTSLEFDPVSGLWSKSTSSPPIVRHWKKGPSPMPTKKRGAENANSGVWTTDTAAVGVQPVLVVTVGLRDSSTVLPQSSWSSAVFTDPMSASALYRSNSYGKLSLVPATETCGTTVNDGVAVAALDSMYHPRDGMETPAVAAAALDSLSCVDWQSFDKDKDKVLELHVVVVLPGTEGALACDFPKCPTTWAATWSSFANESRIVVKGYTVPNIVIVSELGDCDCTEINRVGVIAHELGHSLGAPDLYDTVGFTTRFAKWSLMSGGMWCEPPCSFDAWTRAYLGWVQPQVVTTGPEVVPLTVSGTSPTTDVVQLRLVPNGSPWIFEQSGGSGEFFLVENRDNEHGTWDSDAPGCGVLVWHVVLTSDSGNEVNTGLFHMVDVVPAGGVVSVSGDASDTFPGSKSATRWDCDTFPSSRLSSGHPSCVNMRLQSPTEARCGSAIGVLFNSQTATCRGECCGDKDLTMGEECEAGVGCNGCTCSSGFSPTTPTSLTCFGNATVTCGGKGCPVAWVGDGKCDPICKVAECEFDKADCSNAPNTMVVGFLLIVFSEAVQII